MKRKNDINHLLTCERRARDFAEAKAIPDRTVRKVTQLRLLRTWIDPQLLDDECYLQDMAWPEYRYTDGLARTELFAKWYYDLYIKLYAEQHPDEDVTKKRPIHPDLLRNDPGVISALWIARGHADAAGVPYDVYLERVMRGHMVNDRWERVPRPNQLYGKLAVPRARDALAQDEVQQRLYGPDWDRRFFAAAYRGDPVQEAALSALRTVVTGSESPAEVLSEFLCERQAITKERAIELFGDALVAKAMSIGSREPVSGVTGTGKYAPTCYGLPNLDEAAPCSECQVNSHCVKLAVRVRDEVLRVTGSEDPRKEWKRKSATLRKQRSRAKQKAENEAEGAQRSEVDILAALDWDDQAD